MATARGTGIAGARRALSLLVPLALLLGAAATEALTITGQVLYGKADGATKAAVVDIVAVYAKNPIYMRMQADGLSQTDGGRGQKLFGEAQTATNKALIRAAKAAKVDVVTVPGGAKGGMGPIPDITQQVVELLPAYHVEGKVLTGSVPDARSIAVLDSAALLQAIPAYREYQLLKPDDVNYHFLRKQAQDQFEAAVKKAARDGGYDAVVEKGGVTCRLGPVPDITPQAVAAIRT
jgi:putative intracellular protease/amidase